MFIKDIKWLSKAAGEAEVLVSDGEYECVAFAYMEFDLDTRRGIDALEVFEPRALMVASCEDLGAWRTNAPGFEQKIVARVDSATEPLLSVGGIKMRLPCALPPGAIVGDCVSFECDRLDL